MELEVKNKDENSVVTSHFKIANHNLEFKKFNILDNESNYSKRQNGIFSHESTDYNFHIIRIFFLFKFNLLTIQKLPSKYFFRKSTIIVV